MSLFARAAQFVRIPPGSSAQTLTPKGATSWATDSVRPPTAHLAVAIPLRISAWLSCRRLRTLRGHQQKLATGDRLRQSTYAETISVLSNS